MEDFVNINTDYIMKIVHSQNPLAKKCADFGMIDIIKKKRFFIKIDFQELNKKQYKKILRKLLFIKSILNNKTEIGIDENGKRILGYLINYDKNNNDHREFIDGISAIFYPTRYERYNYIYDTVCDYLDNNFYGKKLCDFQNNKCVGKRNTSSNVGCCRHFKTKILGPLSQLVVCEHLNMENYTCEAKCISCKLFTCDYLEKKGIKFKMKDILLLNTFFNPLQKYFIKYMVFTPKEKIMKILMWL